MTRMPLFGKLAFSVLACALLVSAQSFVVKTVAGAKAPVADGINARDAILSYPQSIAVNSAGLVYVADTDNFRIRVIESDNTIRTYLGNGTQKAVPDGASIVGATVGYVTALAFDAQGALYYSELGAVRKVSGARVTTVAGNGIFGMGGENGPALSARIGQILHISFDPLGRMLLSDSYNHKVWRVELDGRIVTVAGSGMPGFSGDGGSAREAKLYFPVAAVGDAAGNTYIADYYNDRIRRVGADGKIATYAGGKDLWQRMNGPATSSYVSPHDLAFNAAGELLVFDGSYFRVISLAGTITTLNYPVRGLQWAISGARYWTVSSGASGQVYSGSIGGGTSTLIAGKQRYGGDGGKALDALLQEPRGLAFDAQGNLFIADTLNHRIRQLDAAGNIKTVAGTGTPGYVPDQSTAISSPVNAPRSMAVCPDNSVYFADSNNGYIRAVDSTGKIRTVAGTGRYATTSYIEGPGPQVPIGFPYALACDAAGNVFFDGNDNLLYRLQPNGQVTILNEFGSFGLSPTARALSFTRGYIDSIAAGKGGVYVAASGLIWRVGPDGKVVTVAGGGAQAPVSGAAGIHAALAGVDSLALDAQENLLFRAWDYFPDSFGLKLMRLEQSGQITVLAGGGTSQADGAPALGTRFSSLNALAIGPQNRIYFEDGSSIRMLEPAVATALVILRGNRQTGVRGGALPEPIVVKATGAGGEGIAGVLVRFAVTRGAAQVFPSSIATDGQGLAAATVTLGVSDTEVEVTASATGLAPVVFNLTALEPRPSSMIAVQGDNQVVSAGAEAPLPLEVLVRNNDNSPAPGVRVNFSIAAGDGTLSAVFAVTGADGRAGVRVTPRLAGTMAIDASSPGLNSVRFTLQVGPPLTLPAVRDYVVSGFAGNPPPMENVPAREAALGAVPKGLAVDGEGALVFSDPERNQILKVAGGVLFVVAGSSGRASAPPPDGENARDATLSSPGAVAVSPEGGIAFVNEGTSSLHRIDKDGALRRIPLRDGIKAGGLGFLPGGLLAVSDMGGHRILGISPDGSIKTLAGTGSAGDSGDDGPATQAGIQSPGALVAAPDGTIYFVHTVDETQSRIRAVLPGGTIKTVAGTGVAGPASDGGHALQASLGAVLALAYARDGSLYLCNSDSIRRVRPDGTIETLRREVYSTGYASLVAAPDGALYMGRWAYEAGWTGQSLARLERITSNGELVTVAGGADLAAGDDGPAAQARLYRPTGLAWSSGGSLLIADPLAARLRAVDAAGVMKTLAGGGTKPPEAVPAAASDVLVLPRLVTAAPNGSIYFISDAAEICTLTRDGTVRTLANVPADLVGVTALASDIFSNLLFIAAHRDGQRILYRLRPSGELAWLAGGGAQAPGGGVRASALNLQTVTALAVSPANDICLADSLAQAIYCFDDQAALRHLAGDPRGVRTDGAPASRYRLDTIQSFAFGPDGDLYVAAATAVVRAKSDGGAAVRIAGSFDQPGESGDGGAAGEARFNRIAALALDPDEIVYVADGMRVRRLAPARK
jgi:sugar lactone lactonase YvrE